MRNGIHQGRLGPCRVAISAIAALAIVVAAGHAGVAATACATAEEEGALNTRVLQTELMVAALSCGEQQRYNAFVTMFKSELSKRGQALRAMFKRVHGASGEYEMNAFVTKLANDAAQRTANRPADYCASASRLFSEVLATPPAEFSRITMKPEFSSRHGFARCRS
jgi:hypothetical protein